MALRNRTFEFLATVLSAVVVLLSACNDDTSGVDAGDHQTDTAVSDATEELPPDTASESATDATDEAQPPLPDRGVEALAAWDEVPVLRNWSYLQLSSHDPEVNLDYPYIDPANKDFNNFLAQCGDQEQPVFTELTGDVECSEGMDGFIIAASDSGPGFVSRIWMTARGLTDRDHYDDEVIRIYVDDITEPVYEGSVDAWAQTGDAPFVEPLVGWRSGSLVSYLPISFDSSLRILIDELDQLKVYYYHVDVQHTAEATAGFDPAGFEPPRLEAAAALVSASGENPNTGFSNDVDQEQLTLVAGGSATVLDHEGSGTIELVTLELDTPSLETLRGITVRMTWDDQPEPAVDLPLSALFGCHLNLSSFDTLPLRVVAEGETVELAFFLPMPFSSRARIELSNEGAGDVDIVATVGIDPNLPATDWGYFHTHFHSEEAPIAADTLYPFFSETGQGKLVGTFMYLEGLPGIGLEFLEGDEIVEVDGEAVILGTGTEDYFNGGWYFLDGVYDYAFSGVAHWFPGGGDEAGSVSIYRWHLLTDEINFTESIDFDFEYGANKTDTVGRYSSVAFHYLAR